MVGNAHLYGLLSSAAAAHPDNVAVVDPAGETLTYRELDNHASRIGAILRRTGLVPGDRVGICAPKCAGTVCAIFGALQVGGAYVPVDAKSPPRRNYQILTDCSVRCVITDPQRADLLRAEREDEWKIVGELGIDGLIVMEAAQAGEPQGGPSDLAYILYTSGSTGKPKGVMHTHASALAFIDWCSEEFHPSPEDRFSSHAPFHFDLSILDLYVSIKHGARIVLIGDDLGKAPLKLAELIAEQRLTVWYSTPSILRLLLDYGKLERETGATLRLVCFAGEVFPLKHLRALKEVWPHPRYYNLYGPTETNVCTFHEVPTEIPADRTEPIQIGLACSGDELKLVNGAGREVDPGEEGELLVAGASVMQGYWNRPDRTDAAFVGDADGRRWYRTGDVVVDEGNGSLRFLGRRDRMVKRRGYRVEIGEIEAALYRHPDVREAAVVALPDPESGVVIKAFLACPSGVKLSMIALKQFCAANLPAYMVPDRFEFLDELPKTSTDKTDYQTLAGTS